MWDANAKRIVSGLSAGDLVLDIGGWACPFNRANYILDAEPCETRGFYGRTGTGADHQGGETEFFSKETWIQRDICDREPFPFPDGYFDFVICAHTLEDIRDPLLGLLRDDPGGKAWVHRGAVPRRGIESRVGAPAHCWPFTPPMADRDSG